MSPAAPLQSTRPAALSGCARAAADCAGAVEVRAAVSSEQLAVWRGCEGPGGSSALVVTAPLSPSAAPLIEAIAAAQPRSIAVVLTPGAVLLPWVW